MSEDPIFLMRNKIYEKLLLRVKIRTHRCKMELFEISIQVKFKNMEINRLVIPVLN